MLFFITATYNCIFSQTGSISPSYTNGTEAYIGKVGSDLYYSYWVTESGESYNYVIGINAAGKESSRVKLASIAPPNEKRYAFPYNIVDGKVMALAKTFTKGSLTKLAIKQFNLESGRAISGEVDILSKSAEALDKYGMGEVIFSDDRTHMVIPFIKEDKKAVNLAFAVFNPKGEFEAFHKAELLLTDKSRKIGLPIVSNLGDIYLTATNYQGAFKYNVLKIGMDGGLKIKELDLPDEDIKYSILLNNDLLSITYTYTKDKSFTYIDKYGFVQLDKDLKVLKQKTFDIGTAAGEALGIEAFIKRKAVANLIPIGTYHRADGSVVIVTQQFLEGINQSGNPIYSGGATVIFVHEPSLQNCKVRVIKLSQSGITFSMGSAVQQRGDDIFFFYNTDYKFGADIESDFLMRRLDGNTLAEPIMILKNSTNNVRTQPTKFSNDEVFFKTWTDYRKFAILRVKLPQ